MGLTSYWRFEGRKTHPCVLCITVQDCSWLKLLIHPRVRPGLWKSTHTRNITPQEDIRLAAECACVWIVNCESSFPLKDFVKCLYLLTSYSGFSIDSCNHPPGIAHSSKPLRIKHSGCPKGVIMNLKMQSWKTKSSMLMVMAVMVVSCGWYFVVVVAPSATTLHFSGAPSSFGTSTRGAERGFWPALRFLQRH